MLCDARRAPLNEIPGTCERLTEQQLIERYPDFDKPDNKSYLVVPSFTDITARRDLFIDTELQIDRHQRAHSSKIILQKQQTHWVVQHPAPDILAESELDALYSLPFTRKPHPKTPDIPAYRMIKNSVTIARGCSGNCSFCAITRHQGAIVQSRSNASIVEECQKIAALPGFDGTISDLGGPTANLFATECMIGGCSKRDCLYPEVCRHLSIDEQRFLKLLQAVSSIEGINHLFISSGLRMELLLKTPRLLKRIAEKHTPGALKIAPEHSCNDILELMHKEPHKLLQDFVNYCRKHIENRGKKLHLVPYIISAHPGCTEKHALQLARDMKALGLVISKFQDFTPTPGTLSTAMFVTKKSRVDKGRIFVAKNSTERRKQRQVIENFFHRKKRKLAKAKSEDTNNGKNPDHSFSAT